MARQARGEGNSLGTQFGDNHKVKLSRKRSKTNGVKLGGNGFRLVGVPRCSLPVG